MTAPGDWLNGTELAHALGVFLGTFVLEDAAAVSAGLLLSHGSLGWPMAFLACFLGIWLGDAALYCLARFGGRAWFERSRFARHSDKVARSEHWFRQRGLPVLVFSRLLPGARLPTYLAAGFLKWPFAPFLLVTGLAAAAWTFAILWLVSTAGSSAQTWFGGLRDGVFVGAAGALALGMLTLPFLLQRPLLRRNLAAARRLIERWSRWEFWPGWFFYPPVVARCCYLALKHRGLTLPTAANPGIFAGGIVGESKIATLHQLTETAPAFTAVADLLSGDSPEERLSAFKAVMDRRGHAFPVVLKPDLGQRGAGVRLIHGLAEAEAYLRTTQAPLVLQAHAEGPYEAGLFYCRFPGEARGRILSITEKQFPTVVGDGCSTLTDLVTADPRARLIAPLYLRRLGPRADSIPAEGEEIRLVQAGNHAQGCIFHDGGHLHSRELEDRIDLISRSLNGFFIGRYDVRYRSEAELRSGAAFQIVELNGAAAEMTHIYDGRYSILHAYRTLFAQWDLVFRLGAANRSTGTQPLTPLQLWQSWRRFSALARTYPPAD